MAYLANPTWSDHVDKVSQLGLPLLGRQMALFFSGISSALGVGYYIIHGGTDSKALVLLSTTVLALLAVHVVFIIETSWQAQMLSLSELDSRWMWEYVAMQPTRATLIALSQAYLAWRYYALSKGSRKHRRIAYIVSLMTATEWLIYMTITPLTVWKHFNVHTPTSHEYYKTVISRLYCCVCVIAILTDTTLAFCFCKRLWSLRGEDPELDSSVRYVCYVALGVGLSTTVTVFAVAMLFLFGKSDSFRLIAELAPPCYAASFYLSLLSREKIRHTIRTNQHRRVQAVEAGLNTPSDLENAGPITTGEALVFGIIKPPRPAPVSGASRTSQAEEEEEETLSLSQILRENECSQEKEMQTGPDVKPLTITIKPGMDRLKGKMTIISSSSSSSDDSDSVCSPHPQVWARGAASPRAGSAGTDASSKTKVEACVLGEERRRESFTQSNDSLRGVGQ